MIFPMLPGREDPLGPDAYPLQGIYSLGVIFSGNIMIYVNVRQQRPQSNKNKHLILREQALESKSALIALTGTWLTPDYEDVEVSAPGYIII